MAGDGSLQLDTVHMKSRQQLVVGGIIALTIAAAWLIYQYWSRAGLVAIGLAMIPPALVLLRRPGWGLALSMVAYCGSSNGIVDHSFEGSLCLTLIAALVAKLQTHSLSWRFTPFMGLSTLLFALMFATMMWVPHRDSIYLYSFGHAVVISFLIGELVRTAKDFRLILIGAGIGVLISTGSSFFFVYKFFTGGLEDAVKFGAQQIETVRFSGHWGGPNALAHGLAPFIPLFVAFLWSQEKKSLYLLGRLLLFSGLVVVAMSLSRAAILHLLVAVSTAIWVTARRWSHFLALIMLSGIALSIIPVDFGDRIATFLHGSKDASFNERGKILAAGLELVDESLPFGFGTGAFQLYQQDHINGFRVRVFHAHNTYVQVLLENGVIGMLLFLGMLASAFFPVFNFRRGLQRDTFPYLLRIALLSTFCGMLIAMLFEYLIPWPSYWIVFTLMSIFPAVFDEPTASTA